MCFAYHSLDYLIQDFKISKIYWAKILENITSVTVNTDNQAEMIGETYQSISECFRKLSAILLHGKTLLHFHKKPEGEFLF